MSSSLIMHSPRGTFGCRLSPCFSASIISFARLSDINNWRISLLPLIVVLNKIGWDWNFSLGIKACTSRACLSPSLGRSPELLVSGSALPFRIPGRNAIIKSYCARVPAHCACRRLSKALVLNLYRLWSSV